MITFSGLIKAGLSMIQGKCPGVFIMAHKLTGNKDGLEMIEYIVMAALVVAALVVVVAVFGDTIGGMFHAIALSITGKGEEAQKKQQDVQTTSDADMGGARNKADSWSTGD